MNSGGWTALLVLLFLAAAVLRRDLLAIFASILAIATGASALWARFCLSNLAYRRLLGSTALNYGDETTLTLEFENAKPLPLAWLLVRDTFPGEVRLLTDAVQENAPGEGTALVSLLSLSWYQRVSRTHRIVGSHRGRFEFGPAEISSGDLFGHQRRVREHAHVDELLVFPRIVPVDEIGLPSARPMGEWFAPRRILPDPLRYSGVHRYMPGDSPRHVHWRATARTGELQIKEFDPSDTLSLILAVDVQTLARTYEYLPDTLEYVIMAAGSIAMHALDEHYMVGLYANALTREAETWTRIRPGRQTRQATELLSALAAIEPFRGISLERMLLMLIGDLPYGASVITITSLLRPPILEALDSVQQSGHPVLLLTASESMPYVPETIPSFHLGEQNAWHELETLALA
ncbi:MAG: DUF58 domain-containing protein [Anaerolineae bacterium]